MSVRALEVMAPRTKRVRAYFAAVDRVAKLPTVFDPAQAGGFDLDAPPVPWVDLGWVGGFERVCATKVTAIAGGAPAMTQMQARASVNAEVKLRFESWGKLQLALAAGTQQMNLLMPAGGAAVAGSGGAAVGAMALLPGSTATVLQMSLDDASTLQPGMWLAVDADYAGATGYLGAGVSGTYVKSALTDVDYIRRVTLNVGTVASVKAGAVTLETPLLAGTPTAEMKVSRVMGFCDREGSSFFQEWSGLFVAEGQQGERVIWHYPRLQTMSGIGEANAASGGGYDAIRLAGSFRALPVVDAVDGERVVCFRSLVAVQ